MKVKQFQDCGPGGYVSVHQLRLDRQGKRYVCLDADVEPAGEDGGAEPREEMVRIRPSRDLLRPSGKPVSLGDEPFLEVCEPDVDALLKVIDAPDPARMVEVRLWRQRGEHRWLATAGIVIPKRP